MPYLFNEPGSKTYVDDLTSERRCQTRVSLRPIAGLSDTQDPPARRAVRHRAGVREFIVTFRAQTTRDETALAPSWLNDEPVNVKLSGPTSVRLPVAHPRFENYEQEAAIRRDEERRVREASESADRERQRVERQVAQIAAETKALQAATQLALRRPPSQSQSPMVIPVSTFEAPVAIMPNGAIEQLPTAAVAPSPAVPPHVDTAPSSSRASPAPSSSQPPQQHFAPPSSLPPAPLQPPPPFDGPPPPPFMPGAPGVPFQGADGMMYVVEPMSQTVIPFTFDAISNLFAAHGLPLPPGIAPPPPPPPASSSSSAAPTPVGLDFFHAQNGAVPQSQPTSEPSSQPQPTASTSTPPVMMAPPPPPMMAPSTPAFFVPAARSAKIQIRAPVPGQVPAPRPRVAKSPVQSLRGSVMAAASSSSPPPDDYAGPGVPHNGAVYYGAPAPMMYAGGRGPMVMGPPPPTMPSPSTLQLADPAILAAGGSSKGGPSDAYAPDRHYAGTPPA